MFVKQFYPRFCPQYVDKYVDKAVDKIARKIHNRKNWCPAHFEIEKSSVLLYKLKVPPIVKLLANKGVLHKGPYIFRSTFTLKSKKMGTCTFRKQRKVLYASRAQRHFVVT